jgi:hypothetical protein
MHNLMIVRFIGPVYPGYEFPSYEWPLHLTLVPAFEYKGQIKDLSNALGLLLEEQFAIRTTVIGRGLFGEQHNCPAAILWKSERLGSLHTKLVELLTSTFKVKFQKRSNMNGTYNPHVADQHGEYLQVQEPITIDGISLVDRSPDGRPERRKVIENFQLKNSR